MNKISNSRPSTLQWLGASLCNRNILTACDLTQKQCITCSIFSLSIPKNSSQTDHLHFRTMKCHQDRHTIIDSQGQYQ
uniref:Uncharacterized protein n=1 Tax=Medicago truncatula TaxID=3880 RepID=I3SVH4_MEDTR|nr:unknown [Medicago truncatula]